MAGSIISSAQSQYDDALKLIKEKNYEKALDLASEMLSHDSTDNSIKVLLNLRQYETSNPKLFELLGDAYLKSGVKDLAIINYKNELNIDSLNIPARFKLASVFYKDKKYTDAVNQYLDIIAIEPTNKEALLSAGTIFYLGKLYADAVVYLNKYIEIDSTNSEAGNYLVDSYLKLKNYSSAADAADKLLKIVKGNNNLSLLAARSWYGNQNYEKSLSYYFQLPDSLFSYDDYLNAGRSAQHLDKDSLAAEYLLSALQIDSSDKSLLMDAANLFYSAKNYEKAKKYYLKETVINPTYEPAYRFLAFSYLQMKNYDSLKVNLQKAISLNDTVVVSRFWLAQAFRFLDSTGKAMGAFQDVVKLIENSKGNYENEAVETYSYLGQVYFEQKRYNQSVSYLVKVLKFKPNNINYILMAAAAYYSAGETENAIKYYKRVIALDPKNEIAKKGLRLLSAD